MRKNDLTTSEATDYKTLLALIDARFKKHRVTMPSGITLPIGPPISVESLAEDFGDVPTLFTADGKRCLQ